MPCLCTDGHIELRPATTLTNLFNYHNSVFLWKIHLEPTQRNVCVCMCVCVCVCRFFVCLFVCFNLQLPQYSISLLKRNIFASTATQFFWSKHLSVRNRYNADTFKSYSAMDETVQATAGFQDSYFFQKVATTTTTTTKIFESYFECDFFYLSGFKL